MEQRLAAQRVECSTHWKHLSPPLNPPLRPPQKPGQIALQVLLYGVLVLSLAQFGCRVSANFGTYYSVDMPLFLQVAYDYLANQLLYTRSDDLPQLYQPGAGVYKYPPLYQLTIIPWFAQGWPEDVYFIVLRASMLLMYLGSACLVITKAATIPGFSETSKKVFYGVSAITTLWFYPFHATHGVVSEMYILFLISIFICFYSGKTFLSGIFLGIGSMLKIYPVFIIGISILKKNKSNIFGFITGCMLSATLTIWYFGLNENIFFFLKILPILMTEKMDTGVINLNIASFFIRNGISSDETMLFLYQKIVVSIVLILFTCQLKNKINGNLMLLTSLWICAMLLFLTNYWLQYQLILIIPIIVLAAWTLKTHSIFQLLMLGFIIVTMSVDDSWSGTLLERAMQKNHLTLEMLADTSRYASPAHAIIQISPLSVLISLAAAVRVFIPHLLFILIAWTLVKNHDRHTDH